MVVVVVVAVVGWANFCDNGWVDVVMVVFDVVVMVVSAAVVTAAVVPVVLVASAEKDAGKLT